MGAACLARVYEVISFTGGLDSPTISTPQPKHFPKYASRSMPREQFSVKLIGSEVRVAQMHLAKGLLVKQMPRQIGVKD